MSEICNLCEGSGLRVIERPDGTRAAQECACRAERRAARQIASARIPERYQHCTLDNFDAKFQGAHKSLLAASLLAHNFVSKYPLETNGNGLMLVGAVGVGKTHLAVAILRGLVSRGVQGLFWDYRDLTKTIQHTYNANVAANEKDVLRPVFEADLLVLDELGANKVSDWEWDTVAHILNTRYNDRRATIITTNYMNAQAGKFPEYVKQLQSQDGRDAQNATREQTLGDRIGDRMLSRLQEMCVVIEMTGRDFRRSVKRAQFASDDLLPKEPPTEDLPARSIGGMAERELVGRNRLGRFAAPHQPTEKPDAFNS